MVNLHVAYTSPINLPTGPKSESTLTLPQIWAGLQRKIRAGHEFVPAITSCRVLEEYNDPKSGNGVVVREAIFKEGFEPAWAKDGKVKEVCESFPMMRVDFHQPDGSKVMNIVSFGAEGEMLMTYAFDWLHPEIENEEGGNKEKVQGLREKYQGMAKGAVEYTIESVRRMVKEGTIVA